MGDASASKKKNTDTYRCHRQEWTKSRCQVTRQSAWNDWNVWKVFGSSGISFAVERHDVGPHAPDLFWALAETDILFGTGPDVCPKWCRVSKEKHFLVRAAKKLGLGSFKLQGIPVVFKTSGKLRSYSYISVVMKNGKQIQNQLPKDWQKIETSRPERRPKYHTVGARKQPRFLQVRCLFNRTEN